MKGIREDNDTELARALKDLAIAKQELANARAETRRLSSNYLESQQSAKPRAKLTHLALKSLSFIVKLTLKCLLVLGLLTLFFAGGWILVAIMAYSGNTDFILSYNPRRNHWWRKRFYCDDD